MIWHRVDGDGAAVVLLNGIAMSGPSWEPVSAPLTERYRVVRCDFRGQLLTPGDVPPDLATHAGDVAEVLEHLGAAPAHVVSTSFGGAVGVVLAARRPDLVRSLVSIASSDGFTDDMAAEVARWRAACDAVLGGADPAVLSDTLEPVVYSAAWRVAHRDELDERRRQIGQLPRTWFEGLAALLDQAEGLGLEDAPGRVRCPTLVIAAGEDGFIPTARTRALAEAIPGAVFEVMGGAGHAVVVERPEAIVERVVRWIEVVDR
jgi:pimeloyl-ACP methyl ester carboxylesterase